jgi:hypothetical protein
MMLAQGVRPQRGQADNFVATLPDLSTRTQARDRQLVFYRLTRLPRR